MSDETTLLPCPFCGGEVRLMAQHFTDDSHIYRVGCRRCGMEGPHMHDGGQAIAAWNTCAERTCRITASSTDGLCSDNPRHYFELSCGHSFTLDGLEPPNYCEVCGAKVVSE